jgi:amino acid transporter
MEDVDKFDAPSAAPPRTWKVLGLLAMTAMIFSYLGSYAVADALVNAEIVPRWPPNTDPRPRWMILGFSVLMVLFIAAAGVFRWLSRRQLRAIDAMDAE